MDLSLIKPIVQSSSGNSTKIKIAFEKYLQDHQWSFGKKIGQGAYCNVYELMDEKMRASRVVKIQRKVEDLGVLELGSLYDSSRGEQLALNLDHPHLLRPEMVLYWEKDRITSKPGADSAIIAIIMPKIKGESLRQKMDKHYPFAKVEVWKIILQAAKALRYLHQFEIAHRDIKGSNILVKEDRDIIVIDFGIAKKYPSLTPESPIGTVPFISPERLHKKTIGDVGKIDVWSLGVTMMQLIGNPLVNFESYCLSPFTQIEIFSRGDEKSESLLRRMLAYDTTKRCSMNEVIENLKEYIEVEERLPLKGETSEPCPKEIAGGFIPPKFEIKKPLP